MERCLTTRFRISLPQRFKRERESLCDIQVQTRFHVQARLVRTSEFDSEFCYMVSIDSLILKIVRFVEFY